MAYSVDAQIALDAAQSSAASAQTAANAAEEVVNIIEAAVDEAVADGTESATASATSAAASASSAANSADLARLISDIETPDDVITVIDNDPASDFRVQQDARHESSFARLRTFDIEKYGAVVDGATDDGAAIDAALAAASAAGSGLVLLPTGSIRTNRTHSPPAGVYVMGAGADRTTILYGGTYGQMVFDCLEEKSGVSDLSIEQIGATITSRGSSGVGGRAMGNDSLGCGVILSNHRQRCVRVRVKNMAAAVRIDNYDVDGLGTNTVFATGVHVDQIVSDDCHFGFVGRGHKRGFVGDISGTFVNAYAEPPHLIYLTGQTPGLSCQDMVFATGRCFGGVGGDAFKFAGVKGGSVGSLYASDCPGVLTTADCDEFTIDTIVAKRDVTASGNSAVNIGGPGDNVRVRHALLHIVGNGSGAGRGANIGGAVPEATDCAIETLIVDYRDAVLATGSTGVRFNSGVRNRVGRLVVYGQGTPTSVVSATGGTDCSIDNIEAYNCTSLASVTAGDGLVIRYDPTLQRSITGSRWTVLTGGTNTRVVRQGGTLDYTATTTGNQQVYPDRAETMFYTVNVTGTSRPVPNDATKGMRLTMIVHNNTAGVVTMDWVNFTVSGTWTDPAVGKRKSITFIHDGTTFKEVSIGAAV